MPQFGLKTPEQISARTPADLTRFPALPWKLPGAEVVQVTIEVDLQATLELLPRQFARISPPIGRVIVARYPDSPVGSFSEALLLLSIRSRMEPKNYPVSVIVSSDAAREAYDGIWGLAVRTGSVELRRSRDGVTGTEEITATIAAGGPIATLRLPGAYAVEPAMIRYDPFSSVRINAEGAAEVFQYSGVPTVHEARLAKGSSITCQTDAYADPWFRLRSLNMISASFSVADLELIEPVVQAQRPAGGMGGGLP